MNSENPDITEVETAPTREPEELLASSTDNMEPTSTRCCYKTGSENPVMSEGTLLPKDGPQIFH